MTSSKLSYFLKTRYNKSYPLEITTPFVHVYYEAERYRGQRLDLGFRVSKIFLFRTAILCQKSKNHVRTH